MVCQRATSLSAACAGIPGHVPLHWKGVTRSRTRTNRVPVFLVIVALWTQTGRHRVDPEESKGAHAVAVQLDRIAVDGDIADVLEDCDQLSLGLGRLRRQGLITEQHWNSSTERLAEIRASVEEHVTARCVASRPERQGARTHLEVASRPDPRGEREGHGRNRHAPWEQLKEIRTMTYTTVPSSPGQRQAAQPRSGQHPTWSPLVRAVRGRVRALLAAWAEEHEPSSIPRIRWP